MQGVVSAVPAPGFLILAKPRDFRASPRSMPGNRAARLWNDNEKELCAYFERTGNWRCIGRESVQRVKLACRFRKGFIRGADDLRFDGFERLLGRNALDPAMVGELFVIGKIETD